jgi:hypothetical protein
VSQHPLLSPQSATHSLPDVGRIQPPLLPVYDDDDDDISMYIYMYVYMHILVTVVPCVQRRGRESGEREKVERGILSLSTQKYMQSIKAEEGDLELVHIFIKGGRSDLDNFVHMR